MATATRPLEPATAARPSAKSPDVDAFEWPDLPCAPCYDAYEPQDEERSGVPAAQSGCVAGSRSDRDR